MLFRLVCQTSNNFVNRRHIGSLSTANSHFHRIVAHDAPDEPSCGTHGRVRPVQTVVRRLCAHMTGDV